MRYVRVILRCHRLPLLMLFLRVTARMLCQAARLRPPLFSNSFKKAPRCLLIRVILKVTALSCLSMLSLPLLRQRLISICVTRFSVLPPLRLPLLLMLPLLLRLPPPLKELRLRAKELRLRLLFDAAVITIVCPPITSAGFLMSGLLRASPSLSLVIYTAIDTTLSVNQKRKKNI